MAQRVLQLCCAVGRTLGLGSKALLTSEVAVFPPLNDYKGKRAKENHPFASGAQSALFVFAAQGLLTLAPQVGTAVVVCQR